MVEIYEKKTAVLVDIGNSAVKWMNKTTSRSSTAQKNYQQNIDESFFIDCWAELDIPEKVIASSVASEQVWQTLENACITLWNIIPERIFSLAKGFSLINAYKQPAQLGSDRWCAMIAAYHEAKSDFVVIDCGSAVTIDVVEQSGQHLGGYILPGLQMMKQSLGINTAQIQLNGENYNKTLLPGRNTTECVNAGIYLAAASSIESVVNNQSHRLKDLQCYLTGGDAPSIAELLSIPYILMPDLVLRGLAYISENSPDETVL